MEYLIHVCGLVQGVGFRPYVCRLAGEMGLAGSVDNDTGGVSIRLMANPEQKNRFLQRLVSEQPRVARIDSVDVQEQEESASFAGPFFIAPSHDLSLIHI